MPVSGLDSAPIISTTHVPRRTSYQEYRPDTENWQHTTPEWDGRGATLVVPVLRTYLLTPRRHYPITPVLPTPVVGCLSQQTSQPKGEGAEA